MSPSGPWHVDESVACRYAERTLEPTDAASVDAHLLGCETCRHAVARVVGAAEDALLDAAWRGVVEQLDQPRTGWLERLLLTVGVPPTTARLVTTTSRARSAYLVAVGLSLTMAIVASQAPDRRIFGVFLLVAPLGPLLATASAFGRKVDPAHELLMTVPTSSLRLLLVRTAAAVAPALALTAISVLWLLDEGWLAGAWLAPSLALAAGALALSRWVPVELGASIIGAAWVAAPIVLRLRLDELLELLGPPAQLASVIMVVVAGAVFALGWGRTEEGEA